MFTPTQKSFVERDNVTIKKEYETISNREILQNVGAIDFSMWCTYIFIYIYQKCI